MKQGRDMTGEPEASWDRRLFAGASMIRRALRAFLGAACQNVGKKSEEQLRTVL